MNKKYRYHYRKYYLIYRTLKEVSPMLKQYLQAVITVIALTHLTTAQAIDTDGDHYPDEYETHYNTNPTDPQNHPTPTFIVAQDNTRTHEKIQDAIDEINQDYQIILVKPGTYFEKIEIDKKEKLLLISQNGPVETIIDGQNDNRVLDIKSDTQPTIIGFTLQHGHDHGAGIRVEKAASAYLKNIIIRNHNKSRKDGAIYIRDASPLFENCLVINNNMRRGGAVFVRGNSNPNFNHCTFYNNQSRNAGQGFYVNPNSGHIVTIKNSILWNGLGEIDEIAYRPARTTISHSIIQGGFSGTGNKSDNPQLTSEGYITTNSSALNSGITTDLTVDWQGDSRNMGGTPDIGFDELYEESGYEPLSLTPPSDIEQTTSLLSVELSLGEAATTGGEKPISITNNAPESYLPGQTTIEWIAEDANGMKRFAKQIVNVIHQPQTDSDLDGLDDTWEQKHLGDLSQNENDDPDKDGLNNLEEYLNQLNPVIADAHIDHDGDRYPSYFEIKNGTHPYNSADKPQPHHVVTPQSHINEVNELLKDDVSHGDIILFKSGTYDLNETLKIENFNRILLLGEQGAESTILDANFERRIMETNNNGLAYMDGFTFQKGKDEGAAIQIKDTQFFLSNVIFKDIDDSDHGTLYIDDKSSVVISNCLFLNNRTQQGGALYLTADSPNFVTINHCTFYKNTATEQGHAIFNENNSNNTVEIKNSILWNNDSRNNDEIRTANLDLTITNSIVRGDIQNTNITASNILNADPLLTPEGYLTNTNSPALNAGVNSDIKFDFHGEKRPLGQAVDLGFDEFATLTVIPPEDITIEATGDFTDVEIGEATATDMDGNPLDVTPDMTSPFPIGEHTVTWTATDGIETESAVQIVIVQDTTPPVLNIPVDVHITIDDNNLVAIDIGTTTATDIFEPITISDNAPDLFPMGETFVIWMATDANGLQTQLQQRITVNSTDSDGDGLLDEWEQTYLGGLGETEADDYDMDGMTNGEEHENNFDPTQDESLEDADNDRFPNVFEVRNGSNPNDAASIPTAHFNIAAGQSIQTVIDGLLESYQILSVAGGEYNENLTVSIGTPLFLLLGDTTQPTTVIAQNNQTALTIDAPVVIDGLSVTGDTINQAGVLLNSNDVILKQVNFSLLFSENANGAVQIFSGNAQFENCLIANNQSFSGGAVYVADGSASFNHCTFYNNYADDGTHGINNFGTVTLDNSILWNSDEGLVNEVSGNNVTVNTSIVRGVDADPKLNVDGYITHLSPALDQVNSVLVHDIHFEARPETLADLGADEFVDTDNDNLPDWWELQEHGDLTTAENLTADTDGDGLPDYNEFLLGTGPNNTDSDGDGLTDGEEMNTHGTNPLSGDSDGDGIPDNEQVDTVAPVVTPPADVIVEATASNTPVTLGQASAVDNIQGSVPTSANKSGPFSIGTHDITWSASDSVGNVGTATQQVIVQDTAAPVITGSPSVEHIVYVNAPSVLTLVQPSVADASGFTLTHNGPKAPDTFPLGDTTVTWTATDGYSHVSTFEQTVTLTYSPSRVVGPHGPDMDDALKWLLTQQNLDGSFGASEAVKPYYTAQVIQVMEQVNVKDTMYYAAITWLENHAMHNNDSIGRRIKALASHGDDIDAVINIIEAAQQQTAEGNIQGWGLTSNLQSAHVDTANALIALHGVTHSADANAAINFLINQKLTSLDGWSRNPGNQKYDLWTTARVIEAFILYTDQNAALPALIQTSVTELLSNIGSQTELALKAKVLAVAKASGYGGDLSADINAIKALQLENDSWNNDVHDTIHVLNLLHTDNQ